LVLGNQVVHIGLGLGELHLVHALAGVPVQKRLSPEHGRELFGHALEHLLDGRGIADERGRHLQASGWYVTHSRLGVVRYPFDEKTRIFGLHVEHLFVHFFHGHAPAKDAGGRQVPAVPRITRSHHVLRVEHLLDKLGHGQSTVLLTAAGRKWCETGDKEV